MNKRTLRIAGWALGLSLALGGVGAAVALSAPEAAVEVGATSTSTSSWSYSSTYDGVKNPSISIGSVTAAFAKGTGSNDSQGYAKTSSKAAAIRCYASNTITFTCASNITAITFTWGSTTAGGLSTPTGTYTAPNWTGSAKSIVFTVGSGGQQHISGISVTYEVAESVSAVTVTAGSLTGKYKGSAYIQCSAKADGVATNDVAWTLSESNSYVASQTSVTGASIDANGKVTFENNVTVYVFATSKISTGVRGSAVCTASGLVDAPSFGLIESVDGLYDGMTVIIGATNYSAIMSTTQNSNNRGAISANQKGSLKEITTFSDAFQELVVSIEERTDGAVVYSFFTGNGYLYAAGAGDKNNYLRTEEELDDNGKFTVEIVDGVATMSAQGTNTNKYLRFNNTNSLFSCYSTDSSQDNASIFAAAQAISAKQKVDTFVTKHMKMNSISTSYAGDAASGYVACKTDWTNVYNAYDALGVDGKALFVGGGYANAVARLAAWASANNKTLDTTTGDMHAYNVHTFAAPKDNLSLIAAVVGFGLVAAGGLLFLHHRHRKED